MTTHAERLADESIIGIFDNPAYTRIALDHADRYQAAHPFPHVVLDDFLKVHADFNWHHKLQAYRRINALLYLSDDWQPEWKGALEFWDREMTAPQVSSLPIFNRIVIFSTGEHSNHGQRIPNACPPNVYRKVLNLYYYTTHRDDGDMDDPHFTLYKPTASEFAMELGERYRRSAST